MLMGAEEKTAAAVCACPDAPRAFAAAMAAEGTEYPVQATGVVNMVLRCALLQDTFVT